jgi:hypothetical protein
VANLLPGSNSTGRLQLLAVMDLGQVNRRPLLACPRRNWDLVGKRYHEMHYRLNEVGLLFVDFLHRPVPHRAPRP